MSGFFSRLLFGGRRRRERREAARVEIDGALASDGPEAAWRLVVKALAEDPDDDELLHQAGRVLRLAKEPALAVLFDRAADGPHDPQRLFEAGSSLLSAEQPEAAAALLTRALAFVPFDAVVRSELALAQARAARPADALETLALHPCLAEDPGALFEFGWASLLVRDLDAARDVERELRAAPRLQEKLRLALRRARACAPAIATDGWDARGYYFVEHGGLVLDARGPLAGRYAELQVDEAFLGRCLLRLGAFVAAAFRAPPAVLLVDDDSADLAAAVVRACGGELLDARARERLPAGLVVLERADVLDAMPERFDAPGVRAFALTMDHRASLARAPELVGAFAAEVVGSVAGLEAPAVEEPPSLRDLLPFAADRLEHLPPRGERVKSAYIPDAPLPAE